MEKIQADSKRIILITLLPETMALGLVYGPLKKVVIDNDVFSLKYDPYSRIRPVLAAGGYHTVGLKKDGTVVAVGNNAKGQ